MIYNGPAITVQQSEYGILNLRIKSQHTEAFPFGPAVFTDLAHALDAIELQSNASGLIIQGLDCNKHDLCKHYQHSIQQQCFNTETLTEIHNSLHRLEHLAIPTVALINGAAFGPAFEISLCCNYRFVTTEAQFFCPTVTAFGVTPHLGATVRLPHIIGLEQTLQCFTETMPYHANDALKLGLATAKINHNNAFDAAILDLQQRQHHIKTQSKLSTHRLSKVAQFMIFEHFKHHYYKQYSFKHYPAGKILLDTLQDALTERPEHALQQERQAWQASSTTWQAQALTLQYQCQIAGRIEHQLIPPIHDVACMVSTYHPLIAKLAQQGQQLYIQDNGATFSQSDFATALQHDLEQSQSHHHQRSDILPINYCRYVPLNSQIHMVFDFIPESLNNKVIRLNQLQKQVADDCLIITESATLSAQAIADKLSVPQNFLRIHSSVSPHTKSLVEIAAHSKISKQHIDHAIHQLHQLGKMPILVQEQTGLCIQPILFAYITAFHTLINEGVDFAKIDQAMQNFGFLEGPAALLDRIGLKNYLNATQALQHPPLEQLQKLFNRGHGGRSQKFGFYRYDNTESIAQTDHTVYDDLYGEHPFFVLEEQNIIDRMLIPICNATLNSVVQGVVQHAQDADLAVVHGLGFPDFRVGPCYYIQHIGLSEYHALCNRHASLGSPYHVPEIIQIMQDNQQTFYTQGAM